MVLITSDERTNNINYYIDLLNNYVYVDNVSIIGEFTSKYFIDNDLKQIKTKCEFNKGIQLIELARILKKDYHVEKLFFIDDTHFNISVIYVILGQTKINFESILKEKEDSLIEIVKRDLKNSWGKNISLKRKN